MLNKTRTSKIDIDIIAKREKSKNNARKAGLLGLFLGPYGVCFFMFFAFPLVLGIIMSFSTFDGKTLLPSGFAGFDNYIKLFTNEVLSKDFWTSIWNTIRFALIIVPLSIIIPLGLALLTSLKPPGYKFFRACIYLPGIFPLTATGLILLKMFSFRGGFINSFFNISVDWFGDVGACWFMIGLFCLWCGIGGNFIILCAGLENVDKSLYEAVSIDGGNKIHTFFHVTLPGISSQLFLCIFTTFTGYMNLYGQVYILGTGVADQSEMKTAVYKIQDFLLGNSKSYGYAAAMGICLGILIIIIAIIQMVVSKERRGNGKHAKAFEKFKQGR